MDFPIERAPFPSVRASAEGGSDPLATVAGDAGRVAQRMFAEGEVWAHLHASSDEAAAGRGRLMDAPRLAGMQVHALSTRNARRIRLELGELAPTERRFLDAALAKRWYLTHATSREAIAAASSPDGTLTLKSRDRLVAEKAIPPDHDHTMPKDLRLLRGSDFVYAALEAGDAIRKPSSRFGTTIVRFPFEGEVRDEAVSLPGDQEALGLGLRGLSERSARALGASPEQYLTLLSRPFDEQVFARQTFAGGDVVEGTLLQAIKDARDAGLTARLERTSSEDVDEVVNGLGRPQVLLPRAVALDRDGYALHERLAARSSRALDPAALEGVSPPHPPPELGALEILDPSPPASPHGAPSGPFAAAFDAAHAPWSSCASASMSETTSLLSKASSMSEASTVSDASTMSEASTASEASSMSGASTASDGSPFVGSTRSASRASSMELEA